jgi:hypothetical protein
VSAKEGPTRREVIVAGLIALSVLVAVVVDLYVPYGSLILR